VFPLFVYCSYYKEPFRKCQAQDKKEVALATSFLYTVLRAGNFARAQATGANRHGCGGPINDSLNLADIGLPRTVGLAVGVRNVLTEHYALSAYAALCHIDTSSITSRCLVISIVFLTATIIISHKKLKCKTFSQFFLTFVQNVTRA